MQSKCFKARLFISAFCLLFAGTAQAATINVLREANNPHQTAYGLHSNTGAEGHDLDGAQVTAEFGDSANETLTWTADPLIYSEPDGETYRSINGYANGDDINLFMSWDGFEMTTTSLLTSLTINLAPGNAVFDTTGTFDNDPNGGSTPGSSYGFGLHLYESFSNLPGSINVVYSGIVNVAGALAVGDLFTTMTIDFTGLQDGGILGDLSFRSDIDAMRYDNDLSPVPLSASMTFLLFGLLGLGLLGAKRGGQNTAVKTVSGI